VLHSPFQGGIEEMPLGISSMGVNNSKSLPPPTKNGFNILILNITSAIFSRLPPKGSDSLIKACSEEKGKSKNRILK